MQIDHRKVHVEPIQPQPQASLVVRHFELKHFPFLWHCHAQTELTYVVKGSGLRFVGNTIEPYSSGDLCLLGAHLPHSWQSAPERGDVHSICAHFAEDLWGQAFLHLPEMRNVRLLLKEIAPHGIHIVGKTAVRVAGLMSRIGNSSTPALDRFLLLIESLSLVASNPKDQRLISSVATDMSTEDPGAVAINNAITFLNQSIGDVLPSQKEIAGKVGMSPSAFSRLFRRCVGKNYMDYLTEWRIGIACRALLENDDPIVEISLTAGFENLSNFHRRFRNHKGMTPAQWRAKARKAEGTVSGKGVHFPGKIE